MSSKKKIHYHKLNRQIAKTEITAPSIAIRTYLCRVVYSTVYRRGRFVLYVLYICSSSMHIQCHFYVRPFVYKCGVLARRRTYCIATILSSNKMPAQQHHHKNIHFLIQNLNLFVGFNQFRAPI